MWAAMVMISRNLESDIEFLTADVLIKVYRNKTSQLAAGYTYIYIYVFQPLESPFMDGHSHILFKITYIAY
jgi:hypothetical protein